MKSHLYSARSDPESISATLAVVRCIASFTGNSGLSLRIVFLSGLSEDCINLEVYFACVRNGAALLPFICQDKYMTNKITKKPPNMIYLPAS